MTKQKTMPRGRYFTVYLDDSQINHVKRLAVKYSAQEGYCISVSRLVRDALDLAYPASKQLDAFGAMGKRKRMRKKPQQMDFFHEPPS